MSRLMRWETAVTALLIVVFASGAGFSPDFANNDNLSFALDDLSEIALIALPMTLLVVCGQVDLSVASILGLCSALTGKLWDGGMAIGRSSRSCSSSASSAGWSTACSSPSWGCRPSP